MLFSCQSFTVNNLIKEILPFGPVVATGKAGWLPGRDAPVNCAAQVECGREDALMDSRALAGCGLEDIWGHFKLRVSVLGKKPKNFAHL